MTIYFPSLSEEPGSEYTPFQQGMAQLAALGITLAFAIVGGIITGKIRSHLIYFHLSLTFIQPDIPLLCIWNFSHRISFLKDFYIEN